MAGDGGMAIPKAVICPSLPLPEIENDRFFLVKSLIFNKKTS